MFDQMSSLGQSQAKPIKSNQILTLSDLENLPRRQMDRLFKYIHGSALFTKGQGQKFKPK